MMNSPLSARVMVARPLAVPALPVRKMLGAAGRIEKLKLSLMPPGVRNVMLALPSTLKGSLAVDLRAGYEQNGHWYAVHGEAGIGQGGGQGNLAGRQVNGAICCP